MLHRWMVVSFGSGGEGPRGKRKLFQECLKQNLAFTVFSRLPISTNAFV